MSRLTNEDLFNFIQSKDLVKIMGNIFEVEEICDVKMVLSYENGVALNKVISYVTEVYKLNNHNDYLKVWERVDKNE